MRRASVGSFVLAAALSAHPALAIVWPDVPERIDHDLASPDPAVRLAATEKIESLGPARAAPLVLRGLADADSAVRIASAEIAARIRAPGATAIVLPWLGEHDSKLRLEACAVARAIPDPTAVVPLARALSDTDAGVRAAAAEALGVQGSRDAVAPLLGKLDDASVTVRVELVHALARLDDARAVVPLIGKVEDPVAEVRQAVAKALGDLGDPRASAALVLQLRDSSAEVRNVALTALARVHGVDSVDAITPSVTDRNPAVRHAALATLGILARGGAADALRVLIGRLGLDDDATLDPEPTPLRDALVRAGDASVPPLRGVLRGGASPATASSAAWVLGALGASAADADVVAALRRGTLPVIAALRALSAFGSNDDLQIVLEYVGSETSAVRAEAFRALRQLTGAAHLDGRAVEPLVAIAESPRAGTSELVQVIELLGRTRATRAATTLKGFLSARDLATRLAALDALGALGPAGADAAIVPLLSDPLPEVRLHAAEALAASGGPLARDAVLELLASGGELDRAAALTTLAGVLARAPSAMANAQLAQLLDQAVGGERDAVLAALAASAPVQSLLERLAHAGDADDRRTLMSATAGRADAAPMLREHLADPDASVRGEAAWSLGSVGGAEDADALLRLAHVEAPSASDAAVDATAALGRIAARTHAASATTALCGLLADTRPLVRANALAGLSLAAARCGAGEVERKLLGDAAASVRVAAAHTLGHAPRAEDAPPLAMCARTDPSPEVASACANPPRPGEGRPHATLAYVESEPTGDGSALCRALGSYLVELADGLLRAGTTDRRGAFMDPVAPDGPMRLRRTLTTTRR